jgi:hypothetical protein
LIGVTAEVREKFVLNNNFSIKRYTFNLYQPELLKEGVYFFLGDSVPQDPLGFIAFRDLLDDRWEAIPLFVISDN